MGTVTSCIFCFAEAPYPQEAILRDKESSYANRNAFPRKVGASVSGNCNLYVTRRGKGGLASATGGSQNLVRIYSQDRLSSGPSLTSTPSRLFILSNTGNSRLFQTFLRSSSKLPPDPLPMSPFASPQRLPVKVGSPCPARVPVPNDRFHRELLRDNAGLVGEVAL
jgi:hypothetical protein